MAPDSTPSKLLAPSRGKNGPLVNVSDPHKAGPAASEPEFSNQMESEKDKTGTAKVAAKWQRKNNLTSKSKHEILTEALQTKD
ncbi:MAG: hypothetical protein WCS42_10760 [Verrucomicrobiota bacterium]